MPLDGRTETASFEPLADDTIFGETTPLAKHKRTLETLGNGICSK